MVSSCQKSWSKKFISTSADFLSSHLHIFTQIFKSSHCSSSNLQIFIISISSLHIFIHSSSNLHNLSQKSSHSRIDFFKFSIFFSSFPLWIHSPQSWTFPTSTPYPWNLTEQTMRFGAIKSYPLLEPMALMISLISSVHLHYNLSPLHLVNVIPIQIS